jgi:PAS domain S-box-containing protein
VANLSEYRPPSEGQTTATNLAPGEYRQAFYASAAATLVEASDGQIVAANGAACQLLGRSERELKALRFASFADCDDSRLTVAGATRGPWGHGRATLRLRRHDGTAFDADVQSNVFRSDNGQALVLTTLSEKPRPPAARRAARGTTAGCKRLSPAEMRVLSLLSTHLTLRQIAAQLHVSRNTTKSQTIAVYRKLQAHDRHEAVTRAKALGFL